MPAGESKTCTKCGEAKPLGEFYKRHAKCKACYQAKVRAYQQAHPEKRREWGRTYRERHPEAEAKKQRDWRNGPGRDKHLATKKRWRDRNQAKRAAEWAAYYAKNADALKAKRHAKYDPDKKRAERTPEQSRKDRDRRRARLLNAFVEDVRFDDVLLHDEGRCGICRQPIMETTIELDHIIPLAAGGTHEPDNVQLAHRACNRRKATSVAA